MKKVNLFFTILIGLVIFSCSSDDDNGNSTTENQNGFNFNGTFFSTQNAILNDENISDDMPSDISIALGNVNPFTTLQSTGVDVLVISFEAVNIEAGTITEFTNYQVLENANLENFQFTGGNTILDIDESEFMITSGSVTINSVTDTDIDFTFTFTREDGEIVNGNYSGTYSNISQ